MALIDLDFSLEAIEEYKLCQCKSKYTTENECLVARHGMDLAKMVLHNVPTVEAKPVVHAHWVDVNPNLHIGMKCSLCGARIKYSEFFNGNHRYCHKCGAQMDEVVE